MSGPDVQSVILVSGGVGGAKLAQGFELLGEAVYTRIVVNTGDDFVHCGLTVCPDIDTVLYTLGGLADKTRGWGLAGESWTVFERLRTLGGPDWFQLGDRDLATHLYRSHALASGSQLSTVTTALAEGLGIRSRIIPASDDPVRTRVLTDQGNLAFQEYFVREQCQPTVLGIEFEGASTAALPSRISSDCRAELLVLAPSNPFLSLAPVLAIDGMAAALRAASDTAVAVSPIVGGEAIKGPAAQLFRQFGLECSASGWVRYMSEAYPGLIDVWIIDAQDADQVPSLRAEGFDVYATDTIMTGPQEREGLAGWIAGKRWLHD